MPRRTIDEKKARRGLQSLKRRTNYKWSYFNDQVSLTSLSTKLRRRKNDEEEEFSQEDFLNPWRECVFADRDVSTQRLRDFIAAELECCFGDTWTTSEDNMRKWVVLSDLCNTKNMSRKTRKNSSKKNKKRILESLSCAHQSTNISGVYETESYSCLDGFTSEFNSTLKVDKL